MLACLPFAAYSQSNPSMGAAGTTLPTTSGPANAGKLSPVDANFVTNAAEGGLAEVQAGQLATQRGDSTVKAVGQKMVADHTKANTDLEALAKTEGFVVPTAPDQTHVATLVQLRTAKGTSFDNQYLDGQVTDHEKIIAIFQQEADQGSDPSLKAFAAKTLPILQGHLQMVKDALKKSPHSATQG
jgi:putative membrane protein